MTATVQQQPLPPHDEAAEQSALGAAMRSARAFEEVRDIVPPGGWFDPRHAIIFDAITAVVEDGQTPDPIVVGNELERAGLVRKAGGSIYVHNLWANVPTASNAGYYAEIVADKYHRRQLLAVGVHAQQIATGQLDLTEAVQRIRERLATVAAAATGTGTTGDAWQPIDLRPYLCGEVTRPEPTVGLARSDGLRMLYPGKEHAVIGEMESGKSWFASACIAAELSRARHVVYIHFEESDPSDTVERLIELGARDTEIVDLLRFVGPERPVTPQALAALLDPAPSLVVIDGVNEAMALHGLAIREEDGAAQFRRRLVKPCTAVGAATLACDHVVKDRERRGRDALGSIHKGNALSGAMLMLENAEPFGRGHRGRSHVFVTKDRPGHLRRHGRADPRTPGKTFLGELVVDDTRTRERWLDLTLWAPNDAKQDDTGKSTEQDDEVLETVRAIIAAGNEATLRGVRAKAGGRSGAVADALERLVLDGQLIETSGKRGARLFSLPTGSQDHSTPVPSATGSGSGSHKEGNREPVTRTGSGNQSEPVGTTQ